MNYNIAANATRLAKIQKQIANQLGLNYSINNKSVRINYISNNVANIIVNGDWNNKVNFDLSLLK